MLDRSNLTALTPDNFPTFEREAFEGIKLSAKKYETILNIVQHWDENDVKWVACTDEEVIQALSQIKGVGNWTIDMMLIYTLNRPNAFAYDDFHIKQIMTSLYDLNPKSKLKAQMKAISEPWSPFKATAFQYLIAWKKFTQSK
ncbi:MAG: DNA-3-methyladenine glycosylase [Saprospiraceae bacterium]